MPDEGVLDPWVAEWLEANPLPLDDFSHEFLALARGSFELPVTREISKVHDEVVSGIPVRIYEHAHQPTGLIVYFHGGGWRLGSVALMDAVARELAFATGAAVVSVEYRMAPEHPYPAALDDSEMVTRWALTNAASLAASERNIMVAGESAGGNLAAAITLRFRDDRANARPGRSDPDLPGPRRPRICARLEEGVLRSHRLRGGERVLLDFVCRRTRHRTGSIRRSAAREHADRSPTRSGRPRWLRRSTRRRSAHSPHSDWKRLASIPPRCAIRGSPTASSTSDSRRPPMRSR